MRVSPSSIWTASYRNLSRIIFDDCHFTDKGSMRVAEIVLPALKAALDARRVNPDNSCVGRCLP
jgi:lysophospholipase L1-like esterase